MKFIHSYTDIKNNIRSALVVVILLTSFLSSSVPAVQAQDDGTPKLFVDIKGSQPSVKQEARPFVVRSRYVNVDFELLSEKSGTARNAVSKSEIELNLFPDVVYTGVIDRIEKYSPNGISWTGTLKGKMLGYFYLVVSDGVFIAHIASPAGVYEVSSAGNDLYRVIQIDQSQFRDGDDTLEAAINVVDSITTPAGAGPATDNGSQIDVMILYTPSARAGEGSVAAINARVDLAIIETNAAYANSGVIPRLNLVYKGEIGYVESGDMHIDIERLRIKGDGYMDEVHALRDAYGADLVQLVTEVSVDYCGRGYFMETVSASFEEYGFSVIRRDGCMTGYYVSAHEFGHNQSAHHDVYVNPDVTPYPYNHGYIDLQARWATVMAYNNLCEDTPPYTNCTRLQYWSNPTNL